MRGLGLGVKYYFDNIDHRTCTADPEAEEFNGIRFFGDFFTHVTSEHSVGWLSNYEQNVNGIIRQVEDQKPVMKVLVAR